MPETTTTNYGFVKPEVGIVGSPTQWSERLNEDLDAIDDELKNIQDQIDVLVPDAPEEAGPRLLILERMLSGRRSVRRIEANTSVTIDLGAEPADVIWLTTTGSGAKVVTFQPPTPDQEDVDGTADGEFVVQEGYLIAQNFGSGSLSYSAINMTLAWRDGDGGSLGAQSTPGGELRFYKYWLFHSANSSDSPPSSRIYLWRLAV